MVKILILLLCVFSKYCLGCDKYLCENCVSCLCTRRGDSIPSNCTNQLPEIRNDSSCIFRHPQDEEEFENHILQPRTPLYEIKDRPFKLWYFPRHIEGNMKPAFNVTFLIWNSTDFKYRFRFQNPSANNRREDLGGEFSGRSVLPYGSSEVFYDCPFFRLLEGKDEYTLTVLDLEGRGGEYSFIVPVVNRVDPNATPIQDWYVFSYFDVGNYKRQQKLVVTVQLAPFANLTYRIEIRSCLESSNGGCQSGDLVDHVDFHDPRPDAKVAMQVTKLLKVPFGFGKYVVDVRLIHTSCPEEGCRSSRCVVIENTIQTEHLILLICLCVFIVFTIPMVAIYIHIKRRHKNLLLKLKEEPVSLLLLYLPETKKYYNFVETLADFFEANCFVRPFLVDRDSKQKNPNEWTISQMESASRVIFLVPSNQSLASSMPVQHQWKSSLLYFAKSYTTRYGSSNAGVILTDFSCDQIPSEISHLRRFHIVENMTTLVNWIHSGSRTDHWFLWRHAVANEKSLTTFTDVRSSLQELLNGNTQSHTSQTERRKEELILPSQNHLFESKKTNGTVITNKSGQEFDPSIVSVENLLESDEESSTDRKDHSSEDGSSELDDYFL